MVRANLSSSRAGWVLALAGAVVGASASASTAAVVDTTNVSTSSETAFDGAISATDLINAGQATLATTANSNGGSFGFSTAGINNGSAGANGANSAFFYTGNSAANGGFPETSTFGLNTTLSPLGYTITNVNVFAGYSGQAGLGNQVFQLLYSTAAAPATFVSLGTFTYTPDATAGVESTEQLLSSSSGPIATGVAAVQFVFQDPTAVQAITGGGNAGTVIREADVIGTPTTAVPEPASAALAGAAAAGLLGRRRRGR